MLDNFTFLDKGVKTPIPAATTQIKASYNAIG
jgi:hypothetical protein